MRASWKAFGVVAFGLVIANGVRAMADDEDKLAKAPAAVQATVKKAMGDGKLEGVETTKVDGNDAWDCDFSIGGADYAITVNANGDILVREVEVNQAIIPQDVIDAATKTHPDGKVGETNILNAGNKLFYEFEIKAGNDTHDVDVSAKGKVTSDTVEAPEAADPTDKPDADATTKPSDGGDKQDKD